MNAAAFATWPTWPATPLTGRRGARALLAGRRDDAPASHGHLAADLVARAFRRDARPWGRCVCSREVAHSCPGFSPGL